MLVVLVGDNFLDPSLTSVARGGNSSNGRVTGRTHVHPSGTAESGSYGRMRRERFFGSVPSVSVAIPVCSGSSSTIGLVLWLVILIFLTLCQTGKELVTSSGSLFAWAVPVAIVGGGPAPGGSRRADGVGYGGFVGSGKRDRSGPVSIQTIVVSMPSPVLPCPP